MRYLIPFFCVSTIAACNTGPCGVGPFAVAECEYPSYTAQTPEPDEPRPVEIEDLAVCELGPEDTRLDISEGCVDEACVGMTYKEIEEALAAESDCTDMPYERVRCVWPEDGLKAYFDDADADGIPDMGASATALYIGEPWDGTSAEGLGLGVSMACFFDVLGNPDAIDLVVDPGGDYVIERIEYDVLGLAVNDGDADGLADYMRLHGAEDDPAR